MTNKTLEELYLLQHNAELVLLDHKTNTEEVNTKALGDLTPIPLHTINIPSKLPLVRYRKLHGINDDSEMTFLLLGEILQMPGHVTIMNIKDGSIRTVVHSHDLELIPPSEC